MTYQQYRDELACLRDLITTLYNERKYIGDLAGEFDDWLDPYVQSRLAQKASWIKDVRSYRARLSRWFWTSRVGNPPTLR